MKLWITRIVAPALLAAGLLLFGAACDGGDSTAGGAETPAAATTTPEPNVMNTPNPTQVANVPTRTPATPTNTVPEGPAPRVLWMTSDHGGPGLIIVRFETDAPVTASLEVNRGTPGDPAAPALKPVKSTTLGTRHTISIPTGGPGEYALSLTVTDNFGKQGWATFEIGDIYGKQFWGRGQNAPRMITRQLAATIEWTNLNGGTGKPANGQVVLLSKRAGCTTAQACVAEPIATFTQDTVGGDAVSETHRIDVSFPDEEHDYKIIIVARQPENSAFAHFYQFDLIWKL